MRRIKVRKIEDERRSDAKAVFGEALKWGWANTQGRGLEETKKDNSSLSWFTKREESKVISTEFLYYIHEWKYKGPKLSIYSRKGLPTSPEKWREKESRMWYLEPKRELWWWRIILFLFKIIEYGVSWLRKLSEIPTGH